MKTLIIVMGPEKSGKTTTAAQIAVLLDSSGYRMLTFGQDLWITLQEDYCGLSQSFFGTVGGLRRTGCDIAVCDPTPHQVSEIHALSTEDLSQMLEDGVCVLPLIFTVPNAELDPVSVQIASRTAAAGILPILVSRVADETQSSVSSFTSPHVHCRVSDFTTTMKQATKNRPILASKWARQEDENEAEAYVPLMEYGELVRSIKALVGPRG
jgi:hypothetical protein